MTRDSSAGVASNSQPRFGSQRRPAPGFGNRRSFRFPSRLDPFDSTMAVRTSIRRSAGFLRNPPGNRTPPIVTNFVNSLPGFLLIQPVFPRVFKRQPPFVPKDEQLAGPLRSDWTPPPPFHDNSCQSRRIPRKRPYRTESWRRRTKWPIRTCLNDSSDSRLFGLWPAECRPDRINARSILNSSSPWSAASRLPTGIRQRPGPAAVFATSHRIETHRSPYRNRPTRGLLSWPRGKKWPPRFAAPFPLHGRTARRMLADPRRRSHILCRTCLKQS